MKSSLFTSLSLGVWLFSACNAFTEQFVLSGGHPGVGNQKASRNIKVSVSPDGKRIQLNGSETTIERLDSALQEVAKEKGMIWYNKSIPGLKRSDEEPLTTAVLVYIDAKHDPGSIKVLKIAADEHLPVYFSQRFDFEGGNVREVQNIGDVIVALRAPEYPLTAKQHGVGGAGIFHQHINRETGDVNSVTIKKSTGHALLDQCAVDALRQWKYKAPTKFETVAIPITFAPPGSTTKK